MKVIICDDNAEDLRKIEELLIKYKMLHPGRDFMLEKFSDSSRLYQKIEERRLADLYILDMLMPKRTGIDLGRQIRKCGCENCIIYLTSSDDYAMDAYGVRAIRYLLKPVEEDKFFEAIDYGMSAFASKDEKESDYLLKTKDGLVQTPYSQIEYIENMNRRLEVHLIDGGILRSIFIRKSFEEEVRALIGKRNFLQVHKSFVVNLDRVKQLSVSAITMESGRQIPVSKAKAARVKREYLLFISEKCR